MSSVVKPYSIDICHYSYTTVISFTRCKVMSAYFSPYTKTVPNNLIKFIHTSEFLKKWQPSLLSSHHFLRFPLHDKLFVQKFPRCYRLSDEEVMMPSISGHTNYCFSHKNSGNLERIFMEFRVEIMPLEPGPQSSFWFPIVGHTNATDAQICELGQWGCNYLWSSVHVWWRNRSWWKSSPVLSVCTQSITGEWLRGFS
jgi:hypothetical protein